MKEQGRGIGCGCTGWLQLQGRVALQTVCCSSPSPSLQCHGTLLLLLRGFFFFPQPSCLILHNPCSTPALLLLWSSIVCRHGATSPFDRVSSASFLLPFSRLSASSSLRTLILCQCCHYPHSLLGMSSDLYQPAPRLTRSQLGSCAQVDPLYISIIRI
jgi:hypothetical protein